MDYYKVFYNKDDFISDKGYQKKKIKQSIHDGYFERYHREKSYILSYDKYENSEKDKIQKQLDIDNRMEKYENVLNKFNFIYEKLYGNIEKTIKKN
jgi:hypothetical protein